MRGRLAAVLLLVLALLAPVALAFHPGTGTVSRSVTFDHRTGNEWWVELVVGGPAAGSVVAAEARDTGGAWVPLTKRSWGAWAASFHIEPGHEVQFAVRFSDGKIQESCWFTHPQGVEQCGASPEPAQDWAAFRPKAGNEWWVETYVDSGKPLAGVDARANGGAWISLAKRSWGAWAASFRVPDGSLVEFRARATDGATDLSGSYRWSSATLVTADRDETWPVEGSYLKYRVAWGVHASGSGPDTVLNVTLTYSSQRWEAVCEGYTIGYGERQDHEWRAVLEPPRGPTAASVGERVDVGVIDGCRPDTYILHVTGGSTEPTAKRGATVIADTTAGRYEEPECHCYVDVAEWDRETGITIDWHHSGSVTYDDGHLVDTDAPITASDRWARPPRAPWPTEGSFVTYRIQDWDNDTGAFADLTLRFEHTDGEWRWTCRGVEDFGHGAPTETLDRNGTGHPFLGPLRLATGDRVFVNGHGCYGLYDDLVAKGRYAESTRREGEPFRARAWWGDEPDGAADRDAWWDVEKGLVLRWEDREYTERIAWVVDTNAPLRPW